ncbi:MAG: hypothetical protein A2X64_02130 [Ignavibacteria bacterium GWF2_33_9]|nr:MAG: hypothetical protein A2X64_02130 [Ignavibacteria bacterium GWF2_33_9]
MLVPKGTVKTIVLAFWSIEPITGFLIDSKLKDKICFSELCTGLVELSLLQDRIDKTSIMDKAFNKKNCKLDFCIFYPIKFEILFSF